MEATEVCLAAGAFLAGLTVLVLAGGRRWPRFFGTVRERLGYWWCLLAFASVSLRFGRVPLVAGLALASFLSLKEYFTVIPSRRADRAAMAVSYLSIPFVLWFVFIGWYNMFVLTIPVYVFLLLPVILAVQKERAGMVLSLGKLTFGVMLLIYCLGHLGYLYVLDKRWFLAVLILTEAADGAQLVFSRVRASPVLPVGKEGGVRKNWAGLLLSLVVLVPAGLGLAAFSGWPFPHGLVLSLLIPVLSLLGDLVVYGVRQDLGIAGPRELVPGQGLILDRMRGVCYAAPVAFHYLRYFLT